LRFAVRLDLLVNEEAVSVHVIGMIEDEHALLIRWCGTTISMQGRLLQVRNLW